MEAASEARTVNSLESLELTLTEMRSKDRYEITPVENGFRLSHYVIYFCNDDEPRLDREKNVETSAVLGLLNGCGFMRWNGFDGPHPIGVMDGTMFQLKATVNGGTDVRASGSQNFPKGFGEFRRGLSAMLS
jgi:hypothetical protein